MPGTPDLHDIEIRPLSDQLIFVTDRWGEPAGGEQDETGAERLETAGLTRKEVAGAVAPLGDIFRNEVSFLVQRPGMTGMRGLALCVEFEFSDAWQPGPPLHGCDDPAALRAWHGCLTFHAPALLHVARGLDRMQDAIGPARPVFDTAAFYNGAIVAVLPLPVTTDTFAAVHDLLFANGLPFPPSNHARLEALVHLRWRFDPADISADALPGAHLPFAS